LDSLDLGLPSSELFSATNIRRPFGSFLFEDVIERLLQAEQLDRYPVVGFSVHTKYQLFYALRLVQFYFRGRNRPHVTIGGSLLRSLQQFSRCFQPIFDAGVDTIVYGRGDATAFHLSDCIARGAGYESCPGIIFSNGQSTVKNPPSPRRSPELAPDMDFTGMPLDTYLSPVPILNIPASTGCYWARCRFCNYHEAYSAADAAGLAALMETLGRAHQTDHFFFAQSTLNYAHAQSLPDSPLHRNTHVWGSLARIDGEATVDSIPRLYTAGCRKLSLGLETRSVTLRDKMRKGPLSGELESFLHRCHSVGIGTELFLIAGYPGETLRDVRTTLAFVRRYLPYIDTLSANQFSLVCNSAAFPMMCREPEYLVGEQDLTFYDLVDQERPWQYQDHRRNLLREHRMRVFWEELVGIVERSRTHFWRGNTAVRCGFPRLPEHHFLYCASRDRIRNQYAAASVENRLLPYAIGDQVVSIDFQSMTVGGASND
jgi:radical SAM superfamily enzyme YgiQ (UPF0313 family)